MSNVNILKFYLDKAVTRLYKRCSINKSEITIRCNVCGDGDSAHSMRGHFKLTQGKNGKFWYYKCFNEGCRANDKSLPAENWLYNYARPEYNEYISEIFSNNRKHLDYITDEDPLEDSYDETQDTKHFKLISKSKSTLAKTAITYCESRNIPYEIYSKWFIANSGRYKGRLIIPFYDNNDKIYYYQGRDLVGNYIKYLNRKAKKTHCMFNIFNVDITKPVVVLEGPIDSLFVDNAVATLGLEISKEDSKELETMSTYYLLDNDRSGKRRSQALLKQGKYVFLWDNFLKDNKYPLVKDINELILKIDKDKFYFDDLKPYFTNNFYDIFYLGV